MTKWVCRQRSSLASADAGSQPGMKRDNPLLASRFRPGVAVVVNQDFTSNSPGGVQLRKDQKGIVESVDKDGNVYLRFTDAVEQQWVLKHNLPRLTPVDARGRALGSPPLEGRALAASPASPPWAVPSPAAAVAAASAAAAPCGAGAGRKAVAGRPSPGRASARRLSPSRVATPLRSGRSGIAARAIAEAAAKAKAVEERQCQTRGQEPRRAEGGPSERTSPSPAPERRLRERTPSFRTLAGTGRSSLAETGELRSARTVVSSTTDLTHDASDLSVGQGVEGGDTSSCDGSTYIDVERLCNKSRILMDRMSAEFEIVETPGTPATPPPGADYGTLLRTNQRPPPTPPLCPSTPVPAGTLTPSRAWEQGVHQALQDRLQELAMLSATPNGSVSGGHVGDEDIGDLRFRMSHMELEFSKARDAATAAMASTPSERNSSDELRTMKKLVENTQEELRQTRAEMAEMKGRIGVLAQCVAASPAAKGSTAPCATLVSSCSLNALPSDTFRSLSAPGAQAGAVKLWALATSPAVPTAPVTARRNSPGAVPQSPRSGSLLSSRLSTGGSASSLALQSPVHQRVRSSSCGAYVPGTVCGTPPTPIVQVWAQTPQLTPRHSLKGGAGAMRLVASPLQLLPAVAG